MSADSRNIVFTLVFIGLIITKSTAQNYWSVGAQVNVANYFGDLNPWTQYVGADPKFTRPSFMIHATRKFGRRIHVRANFGWALLRGDDFISAAVFKPEHQPRYARNLHFRNDVKEFGITGIFDIFPSSRRTVVRTKSPRARGRMIRERVKWTPYVFAGVGLILHNPRAKTPESLGGEWVALQPLGTEGQQTGLPQYQAPYSLVQPVFPVGIGVRWKLNQRIDIGVEMGLRITLTDYLDDVGGNYPVAADLQSDLARAMSNRTLETTSAVFGTERAVVIRAADGDIRGNSNENDMYLVTGFHVYYILGNFFRRPRFDLNRRRRF
ncbi:MAG TPA: hypothetical protein DCS93_18875 [Microscillaceae bacterium]|nr:hypothetical protein [Microscillaceae bacterium]